jgi:predicted  nucleic acid-binding Zn-ribbon protein
MNILSKEEALKALEGIGKPSGQNILSVDEALKAMDGIQQRPLVPSAKPRTGTPDLTRAVGGGYHHDPSAQQREGVASERQRQAPANDIVVATNPLSKGFGMVRFLDSLIATSAREDMEKHRQLQEAKARYEENPSNVLLKEYGQAQLEAGPFANLLAPLTERLSTIDQNQDTALHEIIRQSDAARQRAVEAPQTAGGRFAADVALAGGDMISSAALAGVTGLPFRGVMATGAGAQTGQQALDEGHSADRAGLLALGSGALTYAVEGLGGIAGTGRVGKALSRSKAGQKLAAAIPAKAAAYINRLSSSKLGKLGADALSEAGEEFIEYYGQNFLQNVILDEEPPYDVKEALYGAAVGGALGGMFGTARALGSRPNTQAAKSAPVSAQSEAGASPITPQNDLQAAYAEATQALKDFENRMREVPREEWTPAQQQEHDRLSQLKAMAEHAVESSRPSFDEQSRTPLETPRANTALPDAARAELREYARQNIPNMTDAEFDAWYDNQMIPADPDFIDRAAKRFGVNIVVGKTLGEGRYDRATNTITVSPNATRADVIRGVVMHEVAHAIERSAGYAEFSDFALNRMFQDDAALGSAVNAKIEQYAQSGVTLDAEGAKAELVAEYVRNTLFADPAAVDALVAQKPGLARQIYDAIVRAIEDAKRFFTGQDLSELEQGRRLFERALNQRGARGTGAQHAIETIPGTDMKYVRADRVVITGDNPRQWGQQITDFINKYVRDGNDVTLYTDDGYSVTLTEDTAGKASFRNAITDPLTGKSRELTNNEYITKLNAEGHIDEIIQIAKLDKVAPDAAAHPHPDIAKHGWRYYKAYFMDFDGGYYELRISSGIGDTQNPVYNIGEIRKRRFPAFTGSSYSVGALEDGRKPSDPNLPQTEDGVKTIISTDGQKDSQHSIAPEDRAKLTAEYQRLLGVYGAIPAGEMPSRNIQIPRQTSDNQKVRQTVRTFAESQHMPGEMLPEFQQAVLDGAFSYAPITNASSVHRANDTIARKGFDAALSQWNAVVEGEGRAKKNDIVLAERLFMEAAQNGDTQTAMQILSQIAAEGTEAGQAIQALEILKRMGPQGQLLTMQQAVNKFNRQSESKRTRKMTDAQKREVVRLRKEASQIDVDLASARQEGATAQAELDAVRAEKAELLKQVRAIEGRIDTAATTAEDIADQLPRFRMLADAVARSYADAQAELDAVRAERDSLKRQIDSLSRREVTASERGGDIGGQLPYLQKQLADLEASYEAALADYEVTRDIYNQAKSTLASLGRRTQGLSRREYSVWWNIHLINEKADAARKTHKAAQEKLADTRAKGAEVARIKQRIAQINGELYIPQEHINDIMSQTTEEGIDAAVERAYKAIAKQIPSTFADKWNAWRYMSMLANPRTHIRNIVGNTIMIPARQLKNLIKTGVQALPAYRGAKTTAILTRADRGLLDFAHKDFEANKRALTSTGKYNPSDALRDNRVIFDGQFFGRSNWLTDKMGKGLEAIRTKNFGALEAEDAFFLRQAYADSLAQFMKANGITAQTADQNILLMNQGRQYATQEALKATFRDANTVATWLSEASRKPVLGVVVEGLVPFKKTPLNIIRRGVEYSPAGLLKTAYDGATKLKSGQIAADDLLDEFAAGLSGTIIAALGWWLASLGMARASGDPDDQKQNQFDRMQGAQDYSLVVDGKSFTLDWAVPAAIPFFVGVEAYSQSNRDGEYTLANFVDALMMISEPLFELSMMQSLNRAIRSAGYSDNPFSEIWTTAISSYFGQAVPTVFGQATRAFVDDTRRNTSYTQSGGNLPKIAQQTINRAQAKTPASETLAPYVDVWGREQKSGSLPERFLENFLSPGYYSEMESTPVDREVQRLYDATGENVLPSLPQKFIQQGGRTEHLDAHAYSELAQERGETAHQTLKEMTEAEAYRKLTAGAQAKLVGDVYALSLAKAKGNAADWYTVPSEHQKALDAERVAGVSYADYLLTKQAADIDGNGSRSIEEWTTTLNESGLNVDQMAYMFDLHNPKAKVNPYDAIREMNLSPKAFAAYYDAVKNIESSKLANGKTISGSLERNRRNALMAEGMTYYEANQYLKAMYG